MTRHLNPKNVRRETDSLLTEVEMALDEWGMRIIDVLKAWGYGDRVAWAAAAAGRDGVLAIIEAEESRLHRMAAHEASLGIGEGLRHG